MEFKRKALASVEGTLGFNLNLSHQVGKLVNMVRFHFLHL